MYFWCTLKCTFKCDFVFMPYLAVQLTVPSFTMKVMFYRVKHGHLTCKTCCIAPCAISLARIFQL